MEMEWCKVKLFDLSPLVVDFNFKLTTKEFQLINECTVKEFNEIGSHSRSQTFHILTEYTILQCAREKYFHQIVYNQKYFHQIPDYYGGIPFACFTKQFNQDISKYNAIFTKGSQKVSLIKSMLQSSTIPVFDLDTFLCPSFDLLNYKYPGVHQYSCMFHDSLFTYCTSHKSEIYARWMQDNYLSIAQFWIEYKKGQQQHQLQLPFSPILHVPDYYNQQVKNLQQSLSEQYQQQQQHKQQSPSQLQSHSNSQSLLNSEQSLSISPPLVNVEQLLSL
jgi:hypothetical protein